MESWRETLITIYNSISTTQIHWLNLRNITAVQSLTCVWLCNPMNCSPLSSSVHGISRARILEWVAISFSKGSSWRRDWTHVPCIGKWILYFGSHQGRLNFKSIVQFSSVAQLYPTLCSPMDCSMPGFSVHHQLRELAKTHVLQVSDAILPSHPLSSPSPPAFNLSRIRVFSNESVLCIRWPKYLSFSFSISPSNEYSGLLSFRIDWFDLLAVQGIRESFLQHHSSKESISKM